MTERAGGQTPEELETLLEDALLLGDGPAVVELFADGGVLVIDDGFRQSQVDVQLLLNSGDGYLAAPRRVVQTADTALLIGDGVVNVARRSGDGSWRYRIAVIQADALHSGRNS